MKINKLNLLFFAIGCMLGSNGYARYKARPLKNGLQQVSDKGSMSVDCEFKVFTKNDCKKYLNSKSIIKKGFQPVQVTITNRSKHDVAISADGFSFSTIAPECVANTLHRDGVARGVGFGIGALCFWWLVIPAIVQGCGAKDYNADMDADFAHKFFNDQVVKAGTSFTGLVFTPRKYFSRKFTVTVKNIFSKESLVLTPQEIKHVA